MISKDNIIIEKTWQDEVEDFFSAKIICSSPIISATADVYISSENLRTLCEQLELFLKNRLITFSWSSGKFGDYSSTCISFDFMRKDLLGHITVEVKMELDDGAPLSKHNCCFFVNTELGMLDLFLENLLQFSKRNNVGYKIWLYEE